MIHIIPSGQDKILCGLNNEEGTSLGFGCNCNKCLTKAREIMNKHFTPNSKELNKTTNKVPITNELVDTKISNKEKVENK